MASSEPRDIRRIVAANDRDDNAVIYCDETNTDVRTDPARPGFASNRIWVAEGTPAPVAGVRETLDLPHTLEPPPGGSVCRFLTIPPDDWFMADLTDEKVSGEVTLVLDSEEVHLQQGDTVVQLGVSHAWSNRTDTPCELFVSSHDGKA